MKDYIKSLPILSIALSLLLIGCETKTEYIESLEPQSIKILDITDNTISVYTTESYQIELSVSPENAEIKAPVVYLYRSSDKDVFIVSENGLITATGIGEAVLHITTTEYPGLRALAMVKVSDRYFDVTSIEVDPEFKNYSMAIGATLDLSGHVTIKPDNATNPAVTYQSSNTEVATITELGFIEAKSLGTTTIKIIPIDGSPVYGECTINVKEVTYTHLDRANWIVTPSHALPKDIAFKNAPESILDGKLDTGLSMVKPGKTFEGVTVPAGDIPSFVVDMGKEETFEYLRIDHRSTSSYEYLRPYKLSLFGSNDNTIFTPILENVAGQPTESNFTIHIPVKVKYRYIKVAYTEWNTKSGSSIQISELNIGNKTFQ